MTINNRIEINKSEIDFNHLWKISNIDLDKIKFVKYNIKQNVSISDDKVTILFEDIIGEETHKAVPSVILNLTGRVGDIIKGFKTQQKSQAVKIYQIIELTDKFTEQVENNKEDKREDPKLKEKPEKKQKPKKTESKQDIVKKNIDTLINNETDFDGLDENIKKELEKEENEKLDQKMELDNNKPDEEWDIKLNVPIDEELLETKRSTKNMRVDKGYQIEVD